MAVRWVAAGESGWRIVAGPAGIADPVVARRAARIASAVEAAGAPGVLGAHAGLRSVHIRFASTEVNPAAVRRSLERTVGAASVDPGAPVAGPVARWSLCGCPACAPDRDWIAGRLDTPWPDVLARFCAAPFEVLAVGFLPGFPYLGPLPAGFDLPRLESPRVRVPAGSVGIGGPHAGIYPYPSPGGWRLLGRVADRLFDPARVPPARFAAGDAIAFVPTLDHGSVHG